MIGPENAPVVGLFDLLRDGAIRLFYRRRPSRNRE